MPNLKPLRDEERECNNAMYEENKRFREVEEIIYRDERVSEVVVVGLPHPKWVEAVTALVVPKKGTQIHETEIIELCRKNLAGLNVPKGIAFIEELPKSLSGKIQKNAIRLKYDQLYAN